MERLNGDAADAVRQAGPPSAVTDVTGYGLVGHLQELARASGVAARVRFAALPWLPGVRALAAAGHVAGGSRRTLEAAAAYAAFAPGLAELDQLLACDAQTSGGLLVALDPSRAEAFAGACAARSVPAVVVARLEAGTAGHVLVE
jgi:selenide,water dikinase